MPAHDDGALLQQNIGLVLAMFIGAFAWLLVMAYWITRPNAAWRNRPPGASAYPRWARRIMRRGKRPGRK